MKKVCRKMKTAGKYFLGTALCLFAAANTLYAQGGKGGKGGKMQMPVSTVGVIKVGQAEDVLVRHYVGRAVPVATVQITARVSGEILKVGFEDGAHVKAGQVLYKLDPVQYDAAVKSCIAKIAENKAKYDYAFNNFKRNDTLMKQNAVSRDTWENAKSAMDGFKATLLSSEAALITAQDNLKNTTIIAPIDGVVGVTNFTKGNYITPSSGVLVSIIQVRPVRVRFAMSSSDLLSMYSSIEDAKQHTQVTVTLADGRKLAEAGTIELANNEVNAKTDAILLYAKFKNEKLLLYPGMTLRVTVRKDLKKVLPSVWPSALMHDSKGSYVYVIGKDNIVIKRSVVPGNGNGERQLIEKGLKVGETVIVKGTNKAFPGMPVNPVMEK